MNSAIVKFAKRERRRLIGMSTEAVILLSLVGVATMIGPFGTFADMTTFERLQYWGFMTIVNWLQLRLLQAGLVHLLGEERFWLPVLGACVLASVPATFEVLWLESVFRPQYDEILTFIELYPQVLGLSTAIMVPVSYYFLRARPAAVQLQQVAQQPTRATVSPFMKRVPIALGTELHALQAEDHYVRVFTAKGDDLILHRFSDAVEELGDLDGLRVHRSWWVARQGLDDAMRRDRKIYLVLKNGTEVPVSRTYQPAVREAGWLA